MVEITGKSYSVKFTFKEFIDLITRAEWDRLYKRIAEKSEEVLGEDNLEFDDTVNFEGSIEFLVSRHE